jgi:hypothetical protein
MNHLLLSHTVLRYLVLLALVWAVFTALQGWRSNRDFRPSDRVAVRAASILCHIQLLVGFGLYYFSPVAQGYWALRSREWGDNLFFGLVHFAVMVVAIVFVTIGSALVKRDAPARWKFSVVLRYYTVGLILILMAIPWPFSPLAQRPWLRDF